MYVPDLDGPGVETAETPYDINERVTVLQELQQFCDNNSSISAASTGIKDVPALILTLAGGGGRPPKSRRQVTVPRSKDRGGNSDFPAGLAGGRLQTASQPSGKEASTMKPARNRAGGVEAVRRVQLHPSRISLSAQQTVKYI
ncbi:hypothetical protein NDU88_001556 [Pleurodeles waltl]|uniref:Uncharacterized protein n=1 Tax=Pleurodeles waltl TaxID=8319 RepID=A0AAV7WM37_PLEWA|nr:hypothetical protein NDU88_001556 [Pleurodeles waltl]